MDKSVDTMSALVFHTIALMFVLDVAHVKDPINVYAQLDIMENTVLIMDVLVLFSTILKYVKEEVNVLVQIIVPVLVDILEEIALHSIALV